MSVVEIARRALLARPASDADTYDPPLHHIVPSAIDSYISLQERYEGEKVLLDEGRHLSVIAWRYEFIYCIFHC